MDAAPLVALATEAQDLARAWRAGRSFPEDGWLIGHDPRLAEELAARGWIGMTWPVEAGGGGRPPVERFVVFEALIAGGAPIASMWFADRQIGPTLLRFGSDDQQRRWLPGILAGTAVWCIGLSEPDAGSDVAGIRTRATPATDGSGDWIVEGQKIWTSGAAHAEWMYLVARTDPSAPPHAGLSDLVVDLHSEGVEVRPIVDLTGNDHFCEVIFHQVRVPGAHLVGTPNGSFRQVMRQMEHERGGIDRLVSNRLLYDDLRRSSLVDTANPVVRQEIARIESMYLIGRQLVLRQVMGDAPASFSAVTKTLCTEFEVQVANFAARMAGPHATILGPDGELTDRIARGACYAPGYTLMGGTTQVLRNIIAERILGLPR